jgi:COMPASS component SWD2
LLRFACIEQSVLVSSDNSDGDHAVRYLSLYDNKFLRAFQGHTDKVVTIAMSPVDDCFMTSAYDRYIAFG